ncbi:ABC transporter permease [Pseudomonas sp. MPFS]|uniref:ABC transporter permease n=1 Tax=Pseudomonas sp. MPFS TaxID=2795724 RepID=UPI001F12E822|nr:ABC transporter permease [Pseudomonas sp. MPFS]UMZ11901.1 ABC transporter permease [Pseudomonas sp. MPFS]
MDRMELVAIRAMLSRELAIWIKDKNSLFLRFILQPGIATVAFGKIVAPHVNGGQEYSLVIITGITMSFVMTFCMLNISNNVMLGYNTRLFETWLCSPIGIKGLVVGLVCGASMNGFIAGCVIITMNCIILGYPVLGIIPALPLIALSSILLSSIACVIYLTPATPANAQGIVPYYVLPMANLGCVYYSYSMLPQEWSYVSLLVPMTYATEALRAAMLESTLYSNIFSAYLTIGSAIVISLLVLFYVAQRRLGEYVW